MLLLGASVVSNIAPGCCESHRSCQEGQMCSQQGVCTDCHDCSLSFNCVCPATCSAAALDIQTHDAAECMLKPVHECTSGVRAPRSMAKKDTRRSSSDEHFAPISPSIFRCRAGLRPSASSGGRQYNHTKPMGWSAKTTRNFHFGSGLLVFLQISKVGSSTLRDIIWGKCVGVTRREMCIAG